MFYKFLQWAGVVEMLSTQRDASAHIYISVKNGLSINPNPPLESSRRTPLSSAVV